jgi:hypothetical protein
MTIRKDKHQTKTLPAKAFDRKVDAGEEVEASLDLSHAQRPGRKVQRVNVDFPLDILRAIDAETKRLGVTRQAFIKMRLADALRRTVNP